MGTASSVDLVPIWRVLPETGINQGAVIIMRDGSFRMILRVGAVNFDMRSPNEQRAITHAFGDFLNSLSPDFPIQIQVHTKNLDADGYMRQFDARRRDPNVPEQIRAMIEDHCRHFEGQVSSRNLIQREFYIVVPFGLDYDPVNKGTDSFPGWGLLKALMTPTEEKMDGPKMEDLKLDVARQQLDQRAHMVEGSMGRMDIPTRRLGESEVRELLHEMFNPDLARRQRMRGAPRGETLFGGPRLEGASDSRRRDPRGPRAAITSGTPPAQLPPASAASPPVRVARPVDTNPAPARRRNPPASGAPGHAPATPTPSERRRAAQSAPASPPPPPGERRRTRPQSTPDQGPSPVGQPGGTPGVRPVERRRAGVPQDPATRRRVRPEHPAQEAAPRRRSRPAPDPGGPPRIG